MSPQSLKTSNRRGKAGEPPQLPPRGPGPKPHILLIDDNEDFIELNKDYWDDYFREEVELHTFHAVPGSDPVAWIVQRINKGEPLNAVLLDQNIPGGNADAILDRLRECPEARYVPVVVVTAFPDKLRGPYSLEKGAIRYKYKAAGGDIEAMFLYEAIFDLPQLRDQIEDLMWMDLNREVSERMSRNENLDDVLQWVSSYLEKHFGVAAIYVFIKTGDNLELQGGNDHFGIGLSLPIAKVPFIKRILEHNAPQSCRVDTLNKEEVGFIRKLIGWRMVATPLIVNHERAGTITLYRSPNQHTFRAKDENFLHHLALEISSRLAEKKERDRVRQRQTSLALFIQEISQAPDEATVANMLCKFLHQEIHDGNDQQSKITVRLLTRGTPEIPRVAIIGVPPNLPQTISDIYHPKSVVARVIRERKGERGGDITNTNPKKSFVPTNDKIRSYLTVPLLSSGLCLGAVNLEHFDTDRYSEEDEVFVNSVAGLTAGSLIALRANNFLKGLLELVNDLIQPGKKPDRENILSRSFKLLYEFTGYARLLHLVPGSNENSPWHVSRVIGPDGEALSQEEHAKWGKHTSKLWEKCFMAKVLNREKGNYTDDYIDIAADDEMGVKTAAILVIKICPGRLDLCGLPNGMLEMLFLLPGSVNAMQKELLKMFGQFIGAILETGNKIERLLGEVTLEGQMAILGRALGQFRHRLKTEIFVLGHALETAERDGWKGEWLNTSRATLEQLSEEISNSKSFVKLPEPSMASVADVWLAVLNKQGVVAQRKEIIFRPSAIDSNLKWFMDREIVAMILENLVQNALEQCTTGAEVWLEAKETADSLLLTVCDTGPGVNPSVVDKLFQPGITTKTNGTGFGLNFSRRRACDMGGELFHEKERQPGAAFTLKLPRMTSQEK